MTITMIAPATAEIPSPGCPRWCDGNCPKVYDGDGVLMHSADKIKVQVTPELLTSPTALVEVYMDQCDRFGHDSEPLITLWVDDAETLVGDHAIMTPAQARELAAALVKMADAAVAR